MNLHDEIHSRTDCAAALAAKDCQAIAATLSMGRTATQSRFVTARTILSECGAIGPSILDSLEAIAASNSAVKWAVRFLGQDSGLDVGNPVTQYMIDQLVIGGMPADQGAALKAMAIQSAPVTAQQVAAAVFNDDGTEK